MLRMCSVFAAVAIAAVVCGQSEAQIYGGEYVGSSGTHVSHDIRGSIPTPYQRSFSPYESAYYVVYRAADPFDCEVAYSQYSGNWQYYGSINGPYEARHPSVALNYWRETPFVCGDDGSDAWLTYDSLGYGGGGWIEPIAFDAGTCAVAQVVFTDSLHGVLIVHDLPNFTTSLDYGPSGCFILRTTDGGTTWQPSGSQFRSDTLWHVSDLGGSDFNRWPHAFGSLQVGPGVLYYETLLTPPSGGNPLPSVMLSTDHGATWSEWKSAVIVSDSIPRIPGLTDTLLCCEPSYYYGSTVDDSGRIHMFLLLVKDAVPPDPFGVGANLGMYDVVYDNTADMWSNELVCGNPHGDDPDSTFWWSDAVFLANEMHVCWLNARTDPVSGVSPYNAPFHAWRWNPSDPYWVERLYYYPYRMSRWSYLHYSDDETWYLFVQEGSGPPFGQYIAATWIGVPEASYLPDRFTLSVAPNPFNPATTFSFALSANTDARLEVFDVLGRRIAILHEGSLPAGEHSIIWDAAGCASGLYVARLTTDGEARTAKLTLLR